MSTSAPTFDAILTQTAANLGIPTDVIKNKEFQTRPVTKARHITFYLAKKIGFMSDRQIATIFDHDPVSVNVSSRKLAKLADSDPELMNRITEIINSITQR